MTVKRIIAFLCAVSMVFALAGCGGGDKPEGVVSDFCKSLKKFDLEGMRVCLEDAGDDPIDLGDEEIPDGIYDLVKKNAGKITYQIGEPVVDGNDAIVPVDFTYQDATEAITAAFGAYLGRGLEMAFSGATDEEMADLLEEILIEKMETIPPTTAEVTVKFECTLTEDGWKIETLGDEILHVLTSNIMRALESVGESLGESLKDFG